MKEGARFGQLHTRWPIVWFAVAALLLINVVVVLWVYILAPVLCCALRHWYVRYLLLSVYLRRFFRMNVVITERKQALGLLFICWLFHSLREKEVNKIFPFNIPFHSWNNWMKTISFFFHLFLTNFILIKCLNVIVIYKARDNAWMSSNIQKININVEQKRIYSFTNKEISKSNTVKFKGFFCISISSSNLLLIRDCDLVTLLRLLWCNKITLQKIYSYLFPLSGEIRKMNHPFNSKHYCIFSAGNFLCLFLAKVQSIV